MATFFQALDNKTTQIGQKPASVLIDISHHFTVKVFCSLIKGITTKIRSCVVSLQVAVFHVLGSCLLGDMAHR